MRRKFYDTLLEWKQKRADRYAMLIDGARRVGKSWIAETFAKKEYETYLKIDFSVAGSRIRDIFNENLSDLNKFFLYLTNETGIKLVPGKSLLIFDEVQNFPRAREAIKILVADGRFHYLETGSLISLKKNVKNIVIPSEELHEKLNPMDFEEFLWATGHAGGLDLAREMFQSRTPLGQSAHKNLAEAYRQYLVVGGMPQAVSEFAKSCDLDEVDIAKRSILEIYRGDIWKHANSFATKIERLFDEIPDQLSRHGKKFRIGEVEKNSRLRDYADEFAWLDSSRIVNICWNSTDPNVGLKMNLDRAAFKCYMADTGLLISHAFDESQLVESQIHRRLLSGNIELNEGMLAENQVAQMLVASGHKLYYHSKSDQNNLSNNMEIDFLIAKSRLGSRHNISPIEVKSGRTTKHVSLDKFRTKYREWLSEPFILCNMDITMKDGITYLPIYMASLL